MSALLAVCQKDSVHLLSDAMAINLTSGAVARLGVKQVLLENRGIAVAGIGMGAADSDFAALVDKHNCAFDDLREATPELWGEMRAAQTAANVYVFPSAITIAGYSLKNGRVMLHVMKEVDGVRTYWPDQVGYIGGPGDNADPARPFHAKMMADPNAFDPCVDGIAFMEAMRRHSPRKCEVGPRPAVGGFVTHTIVTRDGISTDTIHRWPGDRVGECIKLDDEKARPTLADVRAFCDAVTAGMTPAELAELRG